ncbi:MAG: DUF389 domain-containing protein [Tateyamaria sp.]|uniref:DUF389 domain-containing protein n=1 Tax=Tateyamaria sp. TaxID=1929288 RepID=UPI0032957855
MTANKFSTTKDILKFEGSDARGYWKRFSMLLALSVVIATMGLLRNSSAVVIAAMLVAPLMAPILGVAGALVLGRVQRAGYLLLVVTLSASACVVLAWFLVYMSDFPKGILIQEQVLARTDPGIEDLIIALAAGVAGAYVQIQKSEISLLPGAAIGVSLVPPLSASGILLYFGEYLYAYEAALLFVTNLGAIILSACGVYVASGALAAVLNKGKRRTGFSIGVTVTIVGVSLISYQLVRSTYERYLETRTEADLVEALQAWAYPTSLEIIRADVNVKNSTADLWLIVDLSLDTQDLIATVSDLLPQHLKDRQIRTVLKEILGPDYVVAVRYQTRIAGKLELATDKVTTAPSPDKPKD